MPDLRHPSRKYDPAVIVKPLKSVYPQGAKQVLLWNATGKVVAAGQRLASLGVIITNVTTLAKMARFFETGMPLVDKCISVDGSAVKNPKNIIVPIGTSMEYCFEQCGGFKTQPGRVLDGGPMMGRAVASLDEPVVKATSALVAMDLKDSVVIEPTACLHCGKCVEACPLNLNPVTHEATHVRMSQRALIPKMYMDAPTAGSRASMTSSIMPRLEELSWKCGEETVIRS